VRPKVAFLARARNPDGEYPFVPVEIRKGRPVAVEGATYYLRYSEHGKRIVEPVGPNIDQAYIRFQNRELNRTRAQMGLSPIKEDAVQSGTLIADAVAKYVANLESSVAIGKKSKGTLGVYQTAVENFRDHCGVRSMHEITAEVLKEYERWLFENVERRSRGKRINTIANRFRFLTTFLLKNGIQLSKAKNPRQDDKGLLDWADVPRETKPDYINKYSEDELRALLAAADTDEADLIQTFVRTGCRDEEIVYLHWSDVDFKREQIVISDKPKYDWRPKDRESRTIPLEDGVLLKRLAARKARQTPSSGLVFPNTKGEPDHHLIRRLRKAAAKAESTGFKFEGDVTLHRFRRTYASMMISKSDLQTVSALLGHSEIQTTESYLAKDQSKARIGTRTAFKAID